MFCFENTYFLFQGKYYEQVHGAAMGSPISPLIANLFVEEFDVKALSTSPNPPCLWLRFVDDTLVIDKAEHSTQLLHHINSQDPNIKFTVEQPGTDGSIPFLDTKVTPRPNNTIHTTIYRKPTHTDQYLHWNSNHFISAKNSVYSTLAHRAKVVSSTPADLTKELDHLRKALQACLFPNWDLNRIQHQFELKHNQEDIQTEGQQSNHNNRDNTNNKQHKNISMVVPYIHGLVEIFKRTCNKQGFQVNFKGTNIIKQLLMAPKHRDSKLHKTEVVYKYKCPQIYCTEEYIGVSGRTFGDRYKEHLKAPSPIHLHTTITEHPVSPDCFSIVDRESHGMVKNFREVMYIRVNEPSLNRNLGKFQLPHVLDQVLQDTPTLHLK